MLPYIPRHLHLFGIPYFKSLQNIYPNTDVLLVYTIISNRPIFHPHHLYQIPNQHLHQLSIPVNRHLNAAKISVKVLPVGDRPDNHSGNNGQSSTTLTNVPNGTTDTTPNSSSRVSSLLNVVEIEDTDEIYEDDDNPNQGSKDDRKRRGKLPEHATNILKKWLFEHWFHPYPTGKSNWMIDYCSLIKIS